MKNYALRTVIKSFKKKQLIQKNGIRDMLYDTQTSISNSSWDELI